MHKCVSKLFVNSYRNVTKNVHPYDIILSFKKTPEDVFVYYSVLVFVNKVYPYSPFLSRLKSNVTGSFQWDSSTVKSVLNFQFFYGGYKRLLPRPRSSYNPPPFSFKFPGLRPSETQTPTFQPGPKTLC